MFDLRDKVILVTGSSRGIGRAIVEQAAAGGARVVVSSRRQDACDAVAAGIAAAGGTAVAIACNVGRRDEVDALVDRTLDRWGRIDGLVCNAAINPHHGRLSEIDDGAWDKIMATNVRSTLWLAQRVLPGMAERGGGAMVVVSSVGGLRASPGVAAYAVSKAADIGLARELAAEWGAHGVRVNAFCPGFVKTEFARSLWEDRAVHDRLVAATCLKRLAEPDDVAGAVLFLLSPAARYVTGTVLVADGGLTVTLPMAG